LTVITIRSIKSITCRKALALLLTLACIPVSFHAAAAQDTEDFEVWDKLSEDTDLITDMEPQAQDLEEEELLVRLGIIGGAAPGYRGSDEYEFGYAPNVHIVWKDFLFLRGRKLGVEVLDNGHVYGGAFVRYTGGRSEDNDGLEGLGDISRTFTSGLYLNFRYQGLRLKSEVRHDFFDEGHGVLAIIRLGSRVPWKDPLFVVGVETTWASREYMETFFGISTAQSLRSGLPPFKADAGLRDIALTLSSGFKITSQWSISGHFRFRHLLGDAADSPIVSGVGAANTFIVGLGLNYTF